MTVCSYLQRRAMKTRSSSPPLHVHVTESTPVHVHVKKSQGKSRGSSTRSPQKNAPDTKGMGEPGNLRPTALVKTRVPWIPPGRTSTREALYKWEGPTHRLEITPLPEPDPALSSSGALRLADLSTDEEEALHGRINQYERKIDSLMTEVSSLKSERLIAEQQEELAEVTKELEVTERENSRLRLSMEKMQEETDHSRLERDTLLQEKDALLRKLLEVEKDGAAASRQVSALRDAVSRMRTEREISGSESTQLSRQKDLMLQKLETFEETNRALRRLLREQHGREVDTARLSEQRDVILKKLADTEAENTGQLRNKEAENNRLAVQIRNLERVSAQRQGEADALHAQLRQLKQQGDGDKEALKRATRVQRERAERSEDTAGQLTAQLVEKEAQLADALAAAEAFQSRHAQEKEERSRMEVEVTVLNSRVSDLTEQLRSVEEKARSEREGLLDRLHALTSDCTALRLENQSLKVQKLRVEAADYGLQVEQAEREAESVRAELGRELEAVRAELHGRLAELEPLPEALRRAELQLREEQERERAQERRNTELSSSLTQLRIKVEQQGAQVEAMRKLAEANAQSRDLAQVVSKREETIHGNQLRLEEKSRECTALARQLEEALDDARRQPMSFLLNLN
ncbi:hypothetical protein JZ751_005285 [Albula glossodonta]|uniref:Outer dense fiber protein 2 n=1 Tax=Albula glossodonta TaxID=121402 RepID=A0A8T2N542_9TELE|nr:hypothetical protein JZ751_005285 [Albula glossodonta]